GRNLLRPWREHNSERLRRAYARNAAANHKQKRGACQGAGSEYKRIGEQGSAREPRSKTQCVGVNPPSAVCHLSSHHKPLCEPHARAAKQTDGAKARSARRNSKHPKIDRPADDGAPDLLHKNHSKRKSHCHSHGAASHPPRGG